MLQRAICIFFHAISITTALHQVATAAPAPAASNSITWNATLDASTTSSKAIEGFSITQVRHPNPQVVNYTDLYLDTLRKTKSPIPEAVYGHGGSKGALEERQTTINLTGNNADGMSVTLAPFLLIRSSTDRFYQLAGCFPSE